MAERLSLDNIRKTTRKILNPSNPTMPSSITTLPETTSAAVTSAVTSSHKFEIVGYSFLRGIGIGIYVSSGKFYVGGHEWALRFYPDGESPKSTSYIGMFLELADPTREARARFDINVLYPNGKPMTAFRTGETQLFRRAANNTGVWGHAYFLERAKLEASPCLKDDCFTVRCNITVVQSTCTMEDPAIARFITVPPSTLHQDLGKLLTSSEGADVVFEVGEEMLSAHRYVLGARSPVFCAELFGPMMEKGRIKIDDIEPVVFKALLHYIYTDSVPGVEDVIGGDDAEGLTDVMMAQHLLVAADRYGMERLRLICEAKLCEKLDVVTAATTLALAEQHNCQQLRAACMEFIASPKILKLVLATEEFSHLEASCPSISREILQKMADKFGA